MNSADVSLLDRWRIAATGAFDALALDRRPSWTVAIVRIGYGIVLLAWTVTMWFDADDLLGPDGIVPMDVASGSWRIPLDTSVTVTLALLALTAAAIAITIGWHPTPAFVVAFVLLVSVHRRNPLILNSGDLLLRDLALLLALCPTGAALSLDRWRRHGGNALRTAPLVAPWGLRLVQLQVMTVYFFAFWSKGGDTWRSGTAVSTALRLDDLQRFDTPQWLVGNVTLIAILTWGSLAIELALGTLLWVKRLRPVLIVLGITLHVLIDVFILVGFFGALMIVGLLSFLDADAIDRRVDASARNVH